jgi:hypothetical protein
MRNRIVLLAFMMILGSLLLAQPISLSCSPQSIFVNTLNTGSFDPVNPMNQPQLTTVTISNTTAQPFKYQVGIVIKWNETQLVNVTYKSKNLLHPGIPVSYSNRDLITNSASNQFEAPDGDISITQIMNSSDILRSALQAGYFPDGQLRFIMTAIPIEVPSMPNPTPATTAFTVIVKNIKSIFLTYPGKPLGQNPTDVNMNPSTFLWNAINTDQNQYKLTIKEFLPNHAPTSNNVETGGRRVFSNVLSGNMFSEFLPFQNRHYYAWQVSTGLYDESAPFNGTAGQQTQELKSDWFVFRYVANQGGESAANQQMAALINQLNDPQIQYLLSLGYNITGVVVYEGRVYSGQEALELIQSLIGKDITVEIKDN